METTFKYKGKIITTPNLEKKLKRMKIQLSDIKIIETPKKEEKEKSELEDWFLDKEKVVIKSKLDNLSRICYVKKGTRPPINDLINKYNQYSENEINNMYYDIQL